MPAIRKITRLHEWKPKQLLVFAKGATGQKLRIAGTDAFTGGVGTRSTDDVFGGEALGGDWEAAYESNSVATVRSKQATVFGGDATRTIIRNTQQAQQDTDGDLEFEGIFKLKLGAATGMDARIGLMKTSGSIRSGEEVVLRRDDSDAIDTWTPTTVKNSAASTSGAIVIANDTYFRLKIVLESDIAKFYINGVLEAVIVTNLPTDELLKPTMFGDSGAKTDALQAKRVKWNFT